MTAITHHCTPLQKQFNKTRKGEVGGYREYLQGEDLAYVERVINEQLDPFYQRYLGYSQ